MHYLQTLLSFARIQGCPASSAAEEALRTIDDASPELQSALAAIARKLAGEEDAEAQLGEGQPGVDQPAPNLLQEEQHRLRAAFEAQQSRNEALISRTEKCYEQAQEQQQAVGAAVQAVADQLATLQHQEPSRLPLLSVAVPDDVAASGADLLQSLARYLGHVAEADGQAAPSQDQQQQREFERLQVAVQLTASAKVEAQAAEARAQAELSFLQQQGQGGASEAMILGRSVDELEREVHRLQQCTQAAAMQAAVQHAAQAVVQQRAQKIETARRRCAMKQQAVDLLVRHVARQLLIAQLLGQEHAALGQMHSLVQAAMDDGAAVLQATQQRVQQLYIQPSEGSGVALRQPGTGPLQTLPATVHDASCGGSSGGEEVEAAGAVADELLQLRSSLRQLSQQAQQQVQAQQAVFAQLHGLVFQGSDVRNPVLTAPAVQQKLAAAASAAGALQQAATAALLEVNQRVEQGHQRGLQEQVLVDFFTNPQNLAKQAERQRRALDA